MTCRTCNTPPGQGMGVLTGSETHYGRKGAAQDLQPGSPSSRGGGKRGKLGLVGTLEGRERGKKKKKNGADLSCHLRFRSTPSNQGKKCREKGERGWVPWGGKGTPARTSGIAPVSAATGDSEKKSPACERRGSRTNEEKKRNAQVTCQKKRETVSKGGGNRKKEVRRRTPHTPHRGRGCATNAKSAPTKYS